MGTIWIAGGGGGGTGSDDVTATRDKVLSGYTAVTKDSDDEPVGGEMPNQGAVSQALNAGGSYTVPAGYHNGSGKVTANALSGQTSGTAAASQILSGQTAWVNGTKLTGSMPTRSDNPTSAQLLVEDGKVKMRPPAGYYNGSNYTWDAQALVAERGGLTAAKLLRGQSAFGIGGTATNDAILDPQYLLTGYSGYDDGVKKNGTMANQGAKTASLNCGGSYAIPSGYHNGSGRITANNLASQTSANATAATIRSGYTAWVNGGKVTGNLAVTSAISFSAAALSYNTIRISWVNPSRGPWNGVFIQMSTSGYPGTGGGSRAYAGAGTNPNQAGGNNYVDIGGLSSNTQYYFTCTSYCDALGWGTSYNADSKTLYAGLVLYDYGYNPYGFDALYGYSRMGSNYMETYQGTFNTSSGAYLSPFQTTSCPNISSIDNYTSIIFTANLYGSSFLNSHLKVNFCFNKTKVLTINGTQPWPPNMPGTINDYVLTISSSDKKYYKTYCSQYGNPTRIELSCYSGTSESDGELYSVNYRECQTYGVKFSE